MARSLAYDQRQGGAGQPINERAEAGKSYSFGPGGEGRYQLTYDSSRGVGLQTESSKSVRKSRKSRLEQPKTKAQAMLEEQHQIYYVESSRAYQQEKLQSPANVYDNVYQQQAYS